MHLLPKPKLPAQAPSPSNSRFPQCMAKRGLPSEDRQQRRQLNQVIWHLTDRVLKEKAFKTAKGEATAEKAVEQVFRLLQAELGEDELEKFIAAEEQRAPGQP